MVVTGRRLLLVLAIITAAGAAPPGVEAQTSAPKEYEVKAAFLFRFLQFIEWPKGSPQQSEPTVCIGVLGEDPFGAALDEVVQNEALQNRKLAVRRASRADDLKTCSLVFISRSETARVADILVSLSGISALVVSEVPGFAKRGGTINFFLEGKKVRFEINPAAARRHGLRISSELLSLGRIVEAGPSNGDRP